MASLRLATLAMMVLFGSCRAGATVFTLVNKCSYTVWPGTLSGSGSSVLGEGGFTLAPGQSVPLTASSRWSGRFWGRTDCSFDASGKGSCITGDCGNVLNCAQAGGTPPVSLAEFTLGDKDFYDVSLVDGYNVPLSIAAVGGTGDCRTAGCVSDLRTSCPAELSVTSNGQVIACKSACAAFSTPEYCCTGDHGSPQTCSPSKYSQVFKSACPTAYSYAYDDATSTFTCSNADYTITFCPSS
uniref:Pathogenesis-related thaumatin-like protein 3.5 n=1 Tax=Cryptomeria japonica TaxID=3369 RepID=CRJ35_CRYJA|nr:RecName: Full=Pathogenesis-related thaumatin-like protein 3.5; AltName: Allergen=Cry j 3.5; Flags: Precursor [Cryptomeria japonica]BAD90814.1 thaumatin-like protein [Cryptomeria japonica]